MFLTYLKLLYNIQKGYTWMTKLNLHRKLRWVALIVYCLDTIHRHSEMLCSDPSEMVPSFYVVFVVIFSILNLLVSESVLCVLAWLIHRSEERERHICQILRNQAFPPKKSLFMLFIFSFSVLLNMRHAPVILTHGRVMIQSLLLHTQLSLRWVVGPQLVSYRAGIRHLGIS